MMLGLYVIGSLLAIVWLAAKLHETREQLWHTAYERDIYAHELDALSAELAQLDGKSTE
jgi:hypothetical protein